MNQAFSASALNSMEKYVLETVRIWCEYLQEPPEGETGSDDGDNPAEEWSRERDISVWSTLLTLDVLGELCFGSSFGAVKAGHSYITDMMIGGSKMILVVCDLTLVTPACSHAATTRLYHPVASSSYY